MNQDNPILSVRNLEIVDSFNSTLLTDVSFDVGKGEIVAIQGESGSGKTLTALTIMGILPVYLKISRGQIIIHSKNILASGAYSIDKLRGRVISMVFQDPKASFNPLRSIGKQFEEILDLHEPMLSKIQKQKKIKFTIKSFGFNDNERILESFFNELSGGQLQKCAIAMNLLLTNELLILDEPTSSLDFESAINVMNILNNFIHKKNLSIILITHDNKIIEKFATRIIKFRNTSICSDNKHQIRTKKNEMKEQGKELQSKTILSNESEKSLIEINCLTKKYAIKNGFTRIFNKNFIYALKEFSLKLNKGEILGLTGTSGSGKTTLAKCLVGLEDWDSGTITLNGSNLKSEINPKRSAKTGIQMIWQHPFSSLNPAMKIEEIFSENAYQLNQKDEKNFSIKLNTLLDLVGLPKSILKRRPFEISGGECQRTAIANILLLKPKILIADEAISFLDLQSKYKVIELFKKLNIELDLSIIFLSHDIQILEQICNRILYLDNAIQNQKD